MLNGSENAQKETKAVPQREIAVNGTKLGIARFEQPGHMRADSQSPRKNSPAFARLVDSSSPLRVEEFIRDLPPTMPRDRNSIYTAIPVFS